jgi:hypothetical protein
MTPTVQPDLQALWGDAALQSADAQLRFTKPSAQAPPAQYMLLVICTDEGRQLALLQRFQGEGLDCKCLLS